MEYKGIIMGLGNPGPKYDNTRHNLGFAVIDHLLEQARNNFQVESMSGAKFKCELWRCKLFGRSNWWLLAKPLTFMNLSGECTAPLLAWYKLQADDLLVIHDELDIAVGAMRFKSGGGNAGHNGLKSITQHLATPNFHRLRLGIGRPSLPNQDVASYVLSRPSNDEVTLLDKCITYAPRVIESFYTDGSKAASKLALRSAD